MESVQLEVSKSSCSFLTLELRNYVTESEDSIEIGGVAEPPKKFKSYSIEPQNVNNYRYNLSSHEEFKGYGYCFFSRATCPLDQSEDTHIERVICKGSYCNKRSTIEAIYQMEENEVYKFIEEKGVRCEEHMEDTLSNRCYQCNQTHRTELVEGRIEECKRFYEEYNISNPFEHTLTYVIIGAFQFQPFNSSKFYLSAHAGDWCGYLLFAHVFLAAKIPRTNNRGGKSNGRLGIAALGP